MAADRTAVHETKTVAVKGMAGEAEPRDIHKLPQELLDLIVDNLREDKVTLKACTLILLFWAFSGRQQGDYCSPNSVSISSTPSVPTILSDRSRVHHS